MSGPSALVPSPVRIIGTGLIGGSLGLALRGAGVEVQVVDASPGAEALAVELGVGSVPAADAADPALVIIAAPPDVTPALVVRELQRQPQAVVTDVASVKGRVLAGVLAARESGEITEADAARYVGVHPMAGREVSGVIAAQADLFRGRPFVVVPHPGSSPAAVSIVRALGLELGAVPLSLAADAHDDAVARVSHAPQVVASLLGATLQQAGDDALSLSGQGLRDTTRIAASDPRLWVEILGANAAALTPVLAGLRDHLAEILDALDALERGEGPERGARRRLADLIASGNAGVARIPGKHGGARDRFAQLVVLVPDRPGELARLLTEIGQVGVNLEDLRLEHSMGKSAGLAHLSVQAGREGLLTTELGARGWTVVDG
ncbi:prephenate dehydrogenase [Brachybacterium sp. EF45031]|uniref:prephenate dehydrogenase n=1 Tax=Brachybacterium sillae TaxID=2810536 RepID=UPI00217E5658|nr:prephenate dehydrogenase [Brachybacterium sillae]MCS6710610.1 prephenate dehydrogenase [Brachybacterium sillae]